MFKKVTSKKIKDDEIKNYFVLSPAKFELALDTI